VHCLGQAGVDAVRHALDAALGYSSERLPVQIRLVAPPYYSISCTCTEAATGIALLTRAVAASAKEVKRFAGGALAVKEAPRAIDESDAHKGAANLVAKLALQTCADAEDVEIA